MYDHRMLSIEDGGWSETTPDNYEEACIAAEREIVVNREAWRVIRIHLVYDKRPKGVKGRRINIDMPQHGLMVDDRLEPTPWMPDVALFDGWTVFPLRLRFWRKTCETKILRRNPLMDQRLGIGVQIFAPDTLHALNLGVLGEYAVQALWRMIRAQVWNRGRRMSVVERNELSIIGFRDDLFAQYDIRAGLNPLEHIHRVQDVTWAMLGKRKKTSVENQSCSVQDVYVLCC